MASVQVAGGWLRGMLLVSGRSAVRIRSPARGFRTIIPTSCLLRARSARLRGLLGLCQFGPGSLSHRIGQGALPLVRRMQIKSGAYGAAGALRRRALRLGAPGRHGRRVDQLPQINHAHPAGQLRCCMGRLPRPGGHSHGFGAYREDGHD